MDADAQSLSSSLALLDAHMLANSYADGFVPTQKDLSVFEAIGLPGDGFPHAQRWYRHIQSFSEAKRAGLPGSFENLVSAPAPAQSAPSGAPMSRVFILAGQSNMVGRADPTLVNAAPEAQIIWHNDLNFDGGVASGPEYVALQPQRSGWRTDEHGAPLSHWGPEASLALGERVFFAKFAMGSTRIRDHWHPDEPGSQFETLVTFCRNALAAAPPPARFEGLFWLQGESDSGAAKHANAYQANLVRFVTALRGALEAPTLPLVASHVVWPNGKKKVDVVNAALSAACQELGYARCTTAEGLTVAADDHLDTDSVLEVGRRMCAAYKELRP